jgi:hypothetical protein
MSLSEDEERVTRITDARSSSGLLGLVLRSPLGASLKTLLCCSAVIIAKRGSTRTRGQLPPIPWLLSLEDLQRVRGEAESRM